MGNKQTATLADLVYFLLTAGEGAKEKLSAAAIKAGSDGAQASAIVEVRMSTYGKEFERSAKGMPHDVRERLPQPIEGLKYGFPKCTLSAYLK
ncbi:hypothetical protein CLOP_g3438 [Closterium sp. NIES-67]|nr:hypothetical protein CLOP_g3438 [Closterium sp. NIES-67]